MSARNVIFIALHDNGWRAFADPTTDAILSALHAAGYVVVPREATRGLLVSMAMRYRHDFGMTQHEPVPGIKIGLSPREKESLLRTMARLHEEVVGTGFYCAEKEAEYATLAATQESPDEG